MNDFDEDYNDEASTDSINDWLDRWSPHEPTIPPDRKIRLTDELISLTDIRGFVPTMPDPVHWIATRKEGEGKEDWELFPHSEGGVLADHQLTFEYLMLDPAFKVWCEEVASVAAPSSSWSGLDYKLVCSIVLMFVGRKFDPKTVGSALREQMKKEQADSPAPLAPFSWLSMAPNQPAKRKEPHVATYFVQPVAGGLVKIGKTNNLTKRLAALQCGSPVKLKLLSARREDIEAQLHMQFAARRSHGEWFNPDATLMTLIETSEPWELVQKWCLRGDEEN